MFLIAEVVAPKLAELGLNRNIRRGRAEMISQVSMGCTLHALEFALGPCAQVASHRLSVKGKRFQ